MATTCGQCGASLPDGPLRFCNHCGADLTQRRVGAASGGAGSQCSSCGKDIPRGSRVCPWCGRRLPLREVLLAAGVRPKPGKAGCGCGLLGILVSCLTVGAIVGAAVPASMRLAAPVLCPRDYEESVVVRTVEHPAAGETSISGTLYCIVPGRPPEAQNDFLVIAVLAGELLPPGILLLLVLKVLFRKARRGPDLPGSPVGPEA